jgi:hypothetical protein
LPACRTKEDLVFLNDEVRRAMKAVTAYLYEDGRRDYEASEAKDDHIFNHVRILDEFLNGPREPRKER